MSLALNPTVLRPVWQGAPLNVSALTTLRSGGVSLAPYDDGEGGGGLNLATHVGDEVQAVAQNRASLQKLLPSAPIWLNQVHGNTVLDVTHNRHNTRVRSEIPQIFTADASIAVGSGVVCAILTADCLPVLFCDSEGAVVGAAHAGWRGLATGVLENTITAMRAAGAGEILAWLGPAIGPRCFEVGEDVRQAFLAINRATELAFLPNTQVSGKYFADIYHLARLLLQRQGLERISGGDFCTVSETSRFYSYRRDVTTGRMASLIWLN